MHSGMRKGEWRFKHEGTKSTKKIGWALIPAGNRKIHILVNSLPFVVDWGVPVLHESV
jgi:hypothetical protein